MRTTILFCTALTALFIFGSACHKEVAYEPIQVRFHNETTQTFTDNWFYNQDSTAVPTLAPGTYSPYITVNRLQEGAGLPLASFRGNAGGKKIYASSGMFCGTDLTIKDLSPGNYTISIQIVLCVSDGYILRFE